MKRDAVPPDPDRSDSTLLLPYGEHPDGSLVHIALVPAGLACGCRCPLCRKPLIARKGDVRVHHFAHAADPGAACSPAAALETALHRFAKSVIAERMTIWLPAIVASHGDRSRLVALPKELRLDAVRTEEMIEGRRPDIMLFVGDRPLAIEIAVTNFASRGKRSFFRDHAIAAIEIDLSREPRDGAPEELEAAILRTAPRRWLHNEKLDKALAELRAETADAERRDEARRRERAATPSQKLTTLRQSAIERLGEEEGVPWLEATLARLQRATSDGSPAPGAWPREPRRRARQELARI